jgi:alkanesulfonate monooxygenase SsuD/methylene tetrahydromethanopterin reductase-like flavin-dependent oxidoreductase (luciferase family)
VVAGATTRAATGATVIDVGFYHPMVPARRLELSTQLTHTAVADDPGPLREFVAGATGVAPAARDQATIFLTGTPAQARDRLQRRRDATGVSYYVVFDPVFNHARPGAHRSCRATLAVVRRIGTWRRSRRA